MPPEPTVPVTRLEKLWRRLRRKRRRFGVTEGNAPTLPLRKLAAGWACGLADAAADLRKLIDEAQEGSSG